MADENPYSPPVVETAEAPAFEPLEPPQEALFEYTEADYLTTLKHVHCASPLAEANVHRGRTRLLIIAGITAAVGIAASLQSLQREDAATPALAIGAFGAAAWLSSRAVRYRAAVKAAADRSFKQIAEESRNSDLFGPTRIRLEPNELATFNPSGRGYIYWRAIEKIERTSDALFIFLTLYEAVMVPSRAFVSEESFAAFCELAERLRSSGRVDESASESPSG